MSENVTFKNGDEELELSLTDIADIDMSEVEEKRFELRPAGVYHFKCIDATLDTINGKAVAKFETEIVNCHAIVGDGAPEAQIGKKYTEMFFLTSGDSLGYLKGFLSDTGFTGTGSLRELLDAFHGHEFIGAIKHTRDKNDTDKVYTSLQKCKPVAGESAAA